MSFGEDVAELVELSRDPLVAKAVDWPRIPLGMVAKILNGFPWKSDRFSKSAGVPLIRIRDVTTGQTETYYDGPLTEGYWVEPGDLLVGMDGDFNVRRWQSEKGLLNQRVCKIIPYPDAFDTRLLEYLLPGYLQLINQATSSVTVKHLSSRTLAELPLPLPPLAEQTRIVAKLDALTARLVRARAELDRVPVLAERLRDSALADAFDHAIKIGGECVPVSELCSSITDGDHQAPPKSEGGVPFITISAMNDGRIDLSKATRFVPRSYYVSLKATRQPKVGDILYSVTGSFGIPAIVRDAAQFVFQRHIAILRPDPEKCNSEWLARILASPPIRTQAQDVATGTAQLTVPLSGLRAFNIPKLPIIEQREQVGQINAAFARADRLEAEAARARVLLDRLESSLLAKAFRGELVPQDPNDEPAQTLLDRIRAQRATAPQPKRGRKAKVTT